MTANAKKNWHVKGKEQEQKTTLSGDNLSKGQDCGTKQNGKTHNTWTKKFNKVKRCDSNSQHVSAAVVNIRHETYANLYCCPANTESEHLQNHPTACVDRFRRGKTRQNTWKSVGHPDYVRL